MITDLAKYDLLDLLLAGSWPEEEQAKTVIRFTDALAEYVGEKLSEQIDAKIDEDLKQLLQQSTTTPEQVMAFYKEKIPGFEEKLDSLFLEFKKSFLVQVYEAKLEALRTHNQPDLISLWEQILNSAKNDEWENTMNLLPKSLS